MVLKFTIFSTDGEQLFFSRSSDPLQIFILVRSRITLYTTAHLLYSDKISAYTLCNTDNHFFFYVYVFLLLIDSTFFVLTLYYLSSFLS
jgi:hypothetical protein